MSFLPSIPPSTLLKIVPVCVIGWVVVCATSLIILLIALCFAGGRWRIVHTLARIGKWVGLLAMVFAFSAAYFAELAGDFEIEWNSANLWRAAVFTCALPWAGIGLQIWSRRAPIRANLSVH